MMAVNKGQWTSLFESRRQDIISMLVVLAFFVLCFVPIILQGRFFLMLDAFSEMLPERAAAWNAIRHGSLPLWTPLILSGYPLLSMAQIGLAYPLTWGYLFLPPYWAEQIYVLAPYLLTPIFTYCYARYVGRSSTASLLCALAYGYGGVFIIPDIHNGLMPNATMWLPLFLIGIERSRNNAFASSLLWATAPYALSVLTGIGQGFLFVGMVGLAYSLFLVLFAKFVNEGSYQASWFSIVRWRPLMVTIGAIIFSAAIAAFQIFETMRAQRRSIRAGLTYEMFTDPSLTLWGVIKFVTTTPFYSFQDVCTAYVAPLALIMAAIPLYLLIRGKLKDARAVFWIGTAATACVLMMGSNTPLYRLLYHIPLLNKFREPPRYAVIWTFAVAVLAAYGFDALGRIGLPRTDVQEKHRSIIVAVAILVLTLGAGFFWFKPWGPLDLSKFLAVKASFTLLVLLALWHSLKTPVPFRQGLVTLVVALACFVEPFALITSWWWPMTKPASRVTSPTAPTRFLQQFPADENRVYTFVGIFSEELSRFPAVDCPNLTMLYGLQNVAGYEPLLLQRYSRALGNVWLDGVTTLKEFEPDRTMFESNSHVLDLLNNTYLLAFSNPLVQFENSFEKEGIRFAARSFKVNLLPGNHVAFSAMTTSADTVAIVSALAHSAEVLQGMPIAAVRITTMDGQIIERPLRAGIDTAEWAHDRPDVRDVVRHSLAPIFETRQGDPQNSFPAYNYWTRIHLDIAKPIDKIEITNLGAGTTLVIEKITLYDSATTFSTALSLNAGPFDFKKWQPVYNEHGVMILKNNRALPRVWLVAEAEAVDGEEALRRIRGQGERPFDPRQIALLEVEPENLPILPGGPIAGGSTTRTAAYGPNRLIVETNSPAAAVLVVSEIDYPGWVATVDGQPAPIHPADYLLRAVVLPPGKHKVEMRYTASAARKGAIISLFSVVLLLAVGIYGRPGNRKTSLR